MSSLRSADTISRAPDLTAEEFSRARRIAYERAGLSIPDGKENLVRLRLGRRLRDRRVSTFGAYFDLVEREQSGEELTVLIDLLTTNKTDFFRVFQKKFLAVAYHLSHGNHPLISFSQCLQKKRLGRYFVGIIIKVFR